MSGAARLHWVLPLLLLLCLPASLLAQGKLQPPDDKPILEEIPACAQDAKLGTDHGLEVLSDTQGVDFGAYLQQVLQKVRTNWYAVIPQAAHPPVREKGVVAVTFRIQKDGSIARMNFVCQSGDVALDRAAYLTISKSSPFSPLPKEFHGDFLALRINFIYNPDRKKKPENAQSPAPRK